MAQVKAGIVTGIETDQPMGGRPHMQLSSYLDLQSGATWALVWFAVAVIVLFIAL